MVKILFYITIISVTGVLNAQKKPFFYQIDLIIFRQTTSTERAPIARATILPTSSKAIALQPANGSEAPYHLLPLSYSLLKSQYLTLKHSTDYQVLSRYTWRQPVTSQKSVILPKLISNGWKIEGLLQVKHSNYHLFQAELSLASPNQQTTFLLKQKQRLKKEQIYFLDDAEAGMLIKIHPL